MDSIVLQSFLPEIFLSIFLLILLLLNSYIIISLKYNHPIMSKEIFSQSFFLLTCLLFLIANNKIQGFFVNFLFLNDISSTFIKFVVVVISNIILFPLNRSYFSSKQNFIEYFVLFLLSLLSLLLLISASDLLSVYLIIEMQALSFYILACFKRNSAFSTEAGLKYFISGSFFSGIFLLGSSLIFGALGTLNFYHINLLLSIPFSSQLSIEHNIVLVGILLVIFTFLFKIAAAPFHFWAPDVYEGAPLSSTIIFSILPKFSIFYFLFKLISILGVFVIEIRYLFIFSGLLSVFIGSFFALNQKRFKRLIIFSSVAQIGFLITALSINTVNSMASVLFFLTIYIITSFLIWSNFALLSNFQELVSTFFSRLPSPLFISNLSSFFVTNKIWSFSNILIFFSLAGIPPLVGFFAKVFIVSSLIETGDITNSFLLLIISTISVFYYLRIIKIIFFEKIRKNVFFSQVIFFDPFLNTECFLLAFFLFLLLFFFFYPSLLLIMFFLTSFNFFFL
jgi:NADH-quinone oxidoreductase subunit N